MNYDLLLKARRLLQPLWSKAWLKGYYWGKGGANIAICIGKELILVSESDGRLVRHEFVKTTNTQLGKRVGELFQEGGLTQEIKEVISPSGYTAFCPVCGWRDEFDPGLLGETDSRGQGSRELIIKIFKTHDEASITGCRFPTIHILDENLVLQHTLARILALRRK
ncbi:MAG: hypothetical protein ISS83_02845 [Candidatus Pacebacteria bacterium]|nr:hypothetical protein [Candidatus Paceibacterota bacterium]